MYFSFLSQFDIWSLIKRPVTSNPYYLTSRYRMRHAPVRRCKTGVISRRRRKDSQLMGSDCGDSNRSATTTTDMLDLDKEFLEDFDFDADDDGVDSNNPLASYSHSQGVYIRACNRLKVSPNSYVLRNLVNDTLMLKHHLLGPEGLKPIAIALVENSSVTCLDVEDNGLGLDGVRHIVEMYSENTFIVSLNLAQNNLKTEGVKSIIEKLKETDVIQKLDLSGNSLQEYDGDLFREYLEDTRNLTRLRLNHNCFRVVGGEALGECLGWNESLRKVELRWNHLRGNGAKAIAHALSINNTIKYLDVSWNGFYLEGCKEMAQSLLKNSTLELGDNPITASGAYFLLNQLLEMPNSSLVEIDLGYQSVEPNFLTLLEQVQQIHPDLVVVHGAVLGQDVDSKDEEQELMDENPVVVLMEFGNILGYRLIDLFAMMDKDNSKTLTRMEIKNGLLGCNIPLSEKALDNLVQKLDEDGDGEIDYAELIAGRAVHRRKLTKTIMMSREQKVDMEDTEVGRVRKKLKRLMDKKSDASLRPKSGVTILSAVTTVSGQARKGGKLPSEGSGGGEERATQLGSVQEEAGGVTEEGGSSLDDLQTGISIMTIAEKDETDGVVVSTDALVSAMPLPTEENVGILPKLGMRRGSFYRKLME
ncbi:leucine-rich repeat-containing protein 74b-like [Plakobranchus ocellatus]|uniref:Leucine-rich repeat-containing protein 74b-like n=1 Tax=Plakobranchus ocellatus TaxID=259542 RepID=A0AAV3YBA5_9GAST|nr:leucine-rich repeat-containing protein 74b-like [Plakobranchus ocellatus]